MKPFRRSAPTLALACGLGLLTCAQARAQGCESGQAGTQSAPTTPALCRNNHVVDLYQGPLLAPQRVIGLGGAYAALAEGVDALGQNAAAPAVRPAYSTDWFDWELTLSASLLGLLGANDVGNTGSTADNTSTFFYTIGGMVQMGHMGFAVLADVQDYTVEDTSSSEANINLARLRVNAGYSFLGDQLNLGVGLRQVRVSVDATNPATGARGNALRMFGFAPEVGMLIRPDDQPFRVGATYRRAVEAQAISDAQVVRGSDGINRAAGYPVPTAVRWPWELEVGLALSAGPRPLNPRWVEPSDHVDEAYRAIEEARAKRRQEINRRVANEPDPKAAAALRKALLRRESYLRQVEDLRFRDEKRVLSRERRARYRNWPRERILVTAELLVTGPTEEGIALETFLQRQDVPSGQRVTVQPRLGIEGEPLPDRLVMRVGTYIEKSRSQASRTTGLVANARQHFTFGFDVKLFTSDHFGLFTQAWTLTIGGDLAPRYQNIGLSLGAWH